MSLYYKELPDNAVVCLMSPTASGKTDLAFKLYETGRFELVSVDSALIYQDMNIGTAKPSAKELERYPHHLVNIINPSQYYSVANFIEEVALLIEAIHQRGKLPLLVGGTMMYYMALLEGISPVPETLPHIRAQVMAIKE
ncbi:MAG: tRNA (adenosine(37)-N6)-dimethylallyltransferase MiaA, partial [Moraxella sp.]|nr:tRNA (adenosine(37)-N6)-dimethylallyltransferase MiaA [Moraxella sp.]